MRTIGATEDRIQAEIALLTPDDQFEVLPENMAIVEWFIATEDLYVWNGPVCLGLDIKAVRDDALMSDRKYTPEQYQGLRIMGRVFAQEMTRLVQRKHD